MSIQHVELGKMCKVSAGQSAPQGEKYFGKVGNPFIRAGSLDMLVNGGAIDQCEWISDEIASKFGMQLFPENTIVFAKSGMSAKIGRIYRLKRPCYVVSHLATLQTSREIDPQYLYHWLVLNPPTFLIPNESYPSIRLADICSVKIPLFPLPKQKRIAAILDKADALRDKRKKSIAKLDELLRSVFFDMFGDPVTNPKGWDFDSLAKSTKKISDGTHHSPPIVDSGIPYITAKHLRKEGLRFYDDPWYISVDDHLKIYSRCDPTKGDVLYIKDGATTGLAAINRYDFQFSMLSSLALLRPKETLLTPEYLCYWLNNDRVKVSITEQMGGAAIRRLTLTKIKKLRLPIPPLFLQKQFSDIVNEVNKIKEVHIESLKNLETIFFSIQQRAFAGEL